ncbi:MAG: hypothetical protein RR374_00145 [Clostridia bacterium]
MSNITLEVNAKINFCLKVTDILPDGYHALDMVNASVGLFDTIEFATSQEIEVFMEGKKCGTENTAFLALFLLKQKYGLGAKVNIKKGIPMMAGLGGSSADASAVLFAYKHLYNDVLQNAILDSDILQIANKIGSDVAYMYFGGFKRCTHKGEVLQDLPFVEKQILIVVPEVCCSTKEVFAEYKKQNTDACNKDNLINICNSTSDINKNAYNIINSDKLEPASDNKNGELEASNNDNFIKNFYSGQPYGEFMKNDLQTPCENMHPQVKEVAQILKQFFANVVMTGSGSGVIAVVENQKRCNDCLKCLKKCKFYFAKTKQCGIIIKKEN